MENSVIAPLYLSPFVGALAWLILASPNAGLLNVLARDLFGVTGPILNVMTPTGVILVMALYNVPYAYMTVSAALKGMDPSMEEASYLNGAGTFATAVKVTFPVVRPSIVSAFFFVFVLTCGTFSIPAALGGTQAMPFLAVDIYRSVATFPLNYSRAAAIGTLLFWISLIGVAFYRYASRAATRFVTVTARGYRMRMVRLRGWRVPAMLLILAYVTMAIILPYLALLYVAFTRFTSSTILDASFTLENFQSVVGSVAVRQSIGNTLLISILAPTICVLLGVVLAYAIRRLRVRGGGVLDYIAMFPIAVPGIVFGTGIFWTYLMTPAYGTIWILVIAFVASYIPFAYRMIDTSIIQIDKSLEEASSVCGASHLRTAWQMTFKLIRPGILSAWILVFIFSVREISAAILLASPSNKVLSVMSWDYLEFGNVQNAAIIGLLQTLILVAGRHRRPLRSARQTFAGDLSDAEDFGEETWPDLAWRISSSPMGAWRQFATSASPSRTASSYPFSGPADAARRPRCAASRALRDHQPERSASATRSLPRTGGTFRRRSAASTWSSNPMRSGHT